MRYKNIDLKIDQFVQYVNDDKINLIPPFQRGHVWGLKTRQKLIENIVRGKPIPAIFLYKEPTSSGTSYEYNILDGKQRLESLILFIGSLRKDLTIKNVGRYFFSKTSIQDVDFKVKLDDEMVGLRELPADLFRDFQEYVIPTIEIALEEDSPTALDEMIDLFVDINTHGEKVKRFEIVKAMSRDPLLLGAFEIIAIKERRNKDIFYKSKKNDITNVLKKLAVVANLGEANSKVDRMWELLVEIILFMRTRKHSPPIAIIKKFIKAKNKPDEQQAKISVSELADLRKYFGFLKAGYKNKDLLGSRLVTNQIHFYTMITSLISDSLLDDYEPNELIRKLVRFGKIIDETEKPPEEVADTMRVYRSLSAKHTTHSGRREERQKEFTEAIKLL